MPPGLLRGRALAGSRLAGLPTCRSRAARHSTRPNASSAVAPTPPGSIATDENGTALSAADGSSSDIDLDAIEAQLDEIDSDPEFWDNWDVEEVDEQNEEIDDEDEEEDEWTSLVEEVIEEAEEMGEEELEEMDAILEMLASEDFIEETDEDILALQRELDASELKGWHDIELVGELTADYEPLDGARLLPDPDIPGAVIAHPTEANPLSPEAQASDIWPHVEHQPHLQPRDWSSSDEEEDDDDDEAAEALALAEDEEDEESMVAAYYEFEERLNESVLEVKIGDITPGIVVGVERRRAHVDVGSKQLAHINLEEATVLPIRNLAEIMWPGYERDFLVTGYARDGGAVLSLRAFEEELVYNRLSVLRDYDCTMQGVITSANLGGVQCNILGGTEGFVPVSHLGSIGTQLTFAEGEEADEEARNALIGKKIDVKFLEYDEGDGHMTLSARRAESADHLTRFQIGQVVEGVVSKVLEFGLFVDVAGGGTGLLHVSQISHDRVQDLTTLMDVGDRIKVMIMSHDPDRGRLALSTKKLEPQPGDMLRDPQKVFANAERMAELFRVRVMAAESVANQASVGVADAVGGMDPNAAAGGYSGYQYPDANYTQPAYQPPAGGGGGYQQDFSQQYQQGAPPPPPPPPQQQQQQQQGGLEEPPLPPQSMQ